MPVPNPPDGETVLDRAGELDDELTRAFVAPFPELPVFPADDNTDVDGVLDGDGSDAGFPLDDNGVSEGSGELQ